MHTPDSDPILHFWHQFEGEGNPDHQGLPFLDLSILSRSKFI